MARKTLSLRFWQKKNLPVIIQTEAAECGLACLTMIANFWGHTLDMASIRYRFAVSIKGVTLRDLIRIANSLGFTARPLKLNLEQLKQLKAPCILHWNMNHFVVLKKVSKKHIIIHDPAIGIRKLTLEETSDHFSGVALELTVNETFKPIKQIQKFSLLSLMGRIEGLNRSFFQVFILGITLQICALVTPFYFQWIVDEAIIAANFNLIFILGISFLLLVLIKASVEAVRSWVITVLSNQLNFQWLGNTFAHLLRLPLPWFEKRHLGDIVSRFNSIQSIQDGITTKVVESIVDGFLVITTFMMMMLYSVKLAIISFIAVIIYSIIRWRIFLRQRYATAEKIIHAANQESHFLESIRGVQTLRLYNRQDERHASWTNRLVDQFNAEIKLSRLSIIFRMAYSMLFGIERVLIIWLAAILVINNQFSVGMMIAFISYKDQFSQCISSLIDNYCDLSMLRVHGERVADIALTQSEPDEQLELDLGTSPLSIEARNISFRYSDNEPYVLRNINLIIPAGQCIAITGPSGSGKTTLLKILLGLLEPSEGEVLVNKTPLKHVGLKNFRKILGTVMQEDQLFSGSISDNICFFDSSFDSSRIAESAAYAAIHDEINAMPMGYNTLIGDIGTGLSGGQKQRVLLARALYKNPLILALDEATSHLDEKNERLVNDSIWQFNLTRLIVAHRHETIAMAERVVILENGEIVSDSGIVQT